MSDDKPESLAADLTVMAVRLVRWLRAADPSPALSGPEASAMAVIVYSEGITPSRLAELEQVKRPTITKLIDGLVERGLVQRLGNPDDKRSSIMVATRKGREVWEAGQLRRVAPLADRIESLSPDERFQFEAAMPLLAKLTEPPQER
jgi:DNA-binding MarR family transcriptional regulator